MISILLISNSSCSFPFFPVFGDHSKCTSDKWYHYCLYVPQLNQFSGKIQVFFYIFAFFYFNSMIHGNGKIPKMTSSFLLFFLINTKSGLLIRNWWSICIIIIIILILVSYSHLYFTVVWMNTSLFKYLGLFWVFKLISTMLWCEGFQFFHWFPVFFPSVWGFFQAHHLQLLSSSPSCSTVLF